MNNQLLTNQKIFSLIRKGKKLPFAMENYPSRGQTSIQELYQTDDGKFFLKRVSQRNHDECRIDTASGTLAEREYWAYKLAYELGLFVPALWLIDKFTTVQRWLDFPDGKTFKKSTGKMEMAAKNVFECVIFDWVTGQVDRHDANYLYDFRASLIIPVDSAHGFLKFDGAMPDYLHLFEIAEPKQLGRKIKSDIREALGKISDGALLKLVPLREPGETRALVARKNALSGVSCINDLLNLYRSRK